jgi:glucose-6-phosphate dehydrogenase assembly protein OpcA
MSAVGAATASVDVDRLERDLASMWSSAREGGDGAGESGVTRACTLNLVVYVADGEDHERLDDLLEEVNEHSPGRTLILVAHRDRPTPALDAWVSMRCRVLGDSGKQVCGEQVTIEAAGPLVATTPSVVSPLLVPDVPVYLWWKDIPHEEDVLFDRLSRMADRVVIDSVAFDNPRADLVRLDQLIGRQGQPLRVSDLNWGRLTPWRTLLASFWDVPDYRPALAALDSVEIVYRPNAKAPGDIAAKALLLAGWLGSRLGWEADPATRRVEGDAASVRVRAGASSLSLGVRRDASTAADDGRLRSVTLTSGGGAARFSVALSADGAKLATEARIGGDRTVGRVIDYVLRGEAESLSRELAFLRRDSIYEAAVARAAAFVG